MKIWSYQNLFSRKEKNNGLFEDSFETSLVETSLVETRNTRHPFCNMSGEGNGSELY